MPIYIDGKRISEITTSGGWDLDDVLTGLQDGVNQNITLETLSNIIQGDIDDLSPLPDGTPAKVMYYGSSAWGASQSFITDGNNVGIGVNTLSPVAQFQLKSDPSKDIASLWYITDEMDLTTKLMAYTKYGIMHITDSGIYSNIDTEDNASTYGLFVEKGIVAKEHLFLDSLSRIRFGAINGTTGAFTDESVIRSQSNILRSISPSHYTYVGSETASNLTTKIGTNVSVNMKKFDIGASNDIQNWTLISSSATQHGTAWGMSELGGLSSNLSKVTIGNRSGLPYLAVADTDSSITTSNLILFISDTGGIFMRLPTTVGGALGATILQLYNDSGTLKVG